MNDFISRLQYQLAKWMQGRYGSDALSMVLVVVGLLITLISSFFGLNVLVFLSYAILILALFRCFSKNIPKRKAELEAFQKLVAKPEAWVTLMRKRWANRDTTVYFTCPNCKTTLSVPKGKGTLRVTCPKCKTQTTKKS